MLKEISKMSFGLLLVLLSQQGLAHTPPSHAMVFFENIKDGDVVESPVKVKFGIKGFGITPAGTTGKIRHKAGHHHLLINVDQLPDMESPIPRDERHLHFDQGETETTLNLPTGKYTMQLLLGDEEHEPQDPALFSKKITITVK